MFLIFIVIVFINIIDKDTKKIDITHDNILFDKIKLNLI